MKTGRLVAVVVALLLAPAPRLDAHEMGSTRVTASFLRDGTYAVEILVDPEVLVERLGAMSQPPLTTTVAPAQYTERLQSQAALFTSQIELQFDEQRATPSFEYTALPPAPGAAEGDVSGVIRLKGVIPPGARAFRLRYALPYAPYLLTIRDEAIPGGDLRQWVEGDAISRPFTLGTRAAPLGRAQTFMLYLKLGFTHIIPKGLDHILFVLGIFLLSSSWRMLLAQVTAFTIAHSVTLALTIYQVVALPAHIVEPVIALSIAYIGIENALTRSVKPWRILLVFAFGLLHGMGFAGVLQELGLPRSEFGTALVAFNVGVELGQLAVIGIAFALIASWARNKHWYRKRVVIPLSLLIAFTGLYWTIERSAW